jgi:hypothetical protein
MPSLSPEYTNPCPELPVFSSVDGFIKEAERMNIKYNQAIQLEKGDSS